MNRALGHVFLASLLRRRLATALSLIAIALGVALGLAVQLIHSAALDEFGRGMRLLSGEADLQVVGPRGGFDDAVYVMLAQRPEVAQASPVLELEARLPGREGSLRILGIDLFRVAQVAPVLMPMPMDDGNRTERFAVLRSDALFLSAAARSGLGVDPGDLLSVQAGTRELRLTIAGAVPGAGLAQALGVMDIAAAQQVFDRIGRLTRVDIRLARGAERDVLQRRLRALLPAGVEILPPEAAESQAAGLSRAYRVNLTMLTAIALVTGGFLVFSTQLLSVVRRRQEFAFLRALGLDRASLVRGLLAEGGMLGLVGAAIGVALAYAITALTFRLIGGDLGAGYFRGVAPEIHFRPGLSAIYLTLGVLAGVAGAWLPAREAGRMLPARALRSGDEREVFSIQAHWPAAVTCLAGAAAACLLPPVAGVPLFGYVAVALILAGAVLLLPDAARMAMTLLRHARPVLLRLAHARLAFAPGQIVVAGAGVVASVALAVSMAIMVSSFRGSVDEWLSQVLPAGLYVRASSSAATGYLGPEEVARIASLAGIASVQAVRYDTLRLSERSPMTLIARPVRDGTPLPLVSGSASNAAVTTGDMLPVWISEAMADLLRLGVGDVLSLPLAGQGHAFRVAGIWRDYARQHGAAVIELDDYRELTGDLLTNDLGVHLSPGTASEAVMNAVRETLGERTIEISLPGEIRAVSLAIFDRTFLVTYLMQAVAVMIGLFGISTTFAALATSRRKEFGVLQHLGLLRREIGALLGAEAALTAAVGVCVGMAAGAAISVVLVEIVNRQSFHWSMDMSLPVGLLAIFGVSLILLAALAARLSGRQAMRRSAVLAVREDW
jgi:putative ABC transport system permease protein